MKAFPLGLISLQVLAQRTGLGVSTLNYYTNIGLLQVVDRKGNRRLYRELDALKRIEEIRRLRKEGYPLRIIRKQIQEKRGI